MEQFRINEIDLPNPLRKEIHRHRRVSTSISQIGTNPYLTVVEVEYPNFISLLGENACGEFIAAIAAQRETEGWSIISMDASSATLKRPLDYYRTGERTRT